MSFNHVTPISPLQTIERETHKGMRHYRTPDGGLYPSITTILGANEKPEIVAWRNMLGNSKANAEMKRASDRGTAVHEMCEKFLNNEELNTRVYDVSYVKLFNQLKLAMKRVDNIRMLEGSLWSDDLEAAGTVDCVCDFDGVLSIVDFKTSNNFKTEKMIFDYFLQETFYALCYGERTGEYPQQIVTLMCSEKGFLPLVWVKTIDDYVEPLIQRISEFHKKYGQN